MRDIIVIINQILDMIPADYENIAYMRVHLNYVIDDTKYRAPELMCISWKDASLILNRTIAREAKNIVEWTWRDDIMELFLDGLWSVQTNKVRC